MSVASGSEGSVFTPCFLAAKSSAGVLNGDDYLVSTVSRDAHRTGAIWHHRVDATCPARSIVLDHRLPWTLPIHGPAS